MSLPAQSVDNVGALQFPTGLGPFPYLGTAQPGGWYLVKPGQGFEVELIDDYPALAQLIGNRWGGDGITTFALPQAGLFTRGPDGAHALWALMGEDTHTLVTGEIPAHDHTLHDPGHDHGLSTTTGWVTGGSNTVTGILVDQTFVGGHDLEAMPITADPAVTGITIDNAGGGGGHNNIPKALTVNLIIKA